MIFNESSAHSRLSVFLILSPRIATGEANLPRRVIRCVAPAYPKQAKDKRIQGKTAVRLRINPEGEVIDADPILVTQCSGGTFYGRSNNGALREQMTPLCSM